MKTMAWIKKGEESSVKDVFLRNIGASSLEEVNGWFKKSYAYEYRIDRLKEAVSFAREYMNKPVTIVGDFDSDGVTSTTILYKALTWAGFKNVRFRIPKRFSEGFGINLSIINEIKEGLVITCDNGIAQVDAIKAAKDKGLAVIIIDHHQPVIEEGKIILPPADIIIDPNALEGSADFCGYCGAGLSYRFACEMLERDKVKCVQLLGLAAIGTVADVMELREENYVFVRNGLKYLLDSRVCPSGLFALISALGLNRHISAADIGFKIGPTINAASRMKDDGATDAVNLLIFKGSYPEAIGMAEKLIALNEERKEAKKEGLRLAHEMIEDECLFGDIPLVLYLPGIKEGIAGIIAGNLCEEFKVPAVVLTDAKDGSLKGSARSCGNYDIKAELDKCADLLLRYGGHTGAAGLSLKKEIFEALRARLNENATSFVFESASDIFYDLEISASQIPSMIEELDKYEPFGEGNAHIVFKVNDFSVVPRYGAYKKLMGADESIVKIYASQVTAIGFDMAKKMEKIAQPKLLNLVGTLSDNYFNGSVEHQIEFCDFVQSDVKKVATPLAERLKAMATAK